MPSAKMVILKAVHGITDHTESSQCKITAAIYNGSSHFIGKF